MAGGAILIVVGMLLFMAVGAYFSHQQQQKRIAELQAFAGEHGWHLDTSQDSFHDSRYPHFSIFSQGHSRYAYNTILGQISVGDQQWPIKLGDYHYKVTTHSNKKRRTTTYRFSYCLVELPFPGVPQLTIRTESIFDKLGSFLGFDDIDFESAEFSDRFSVKSSDKKFAYDVIDPRMMEFLLDSDPPKIELEDGDSCFSEGTGCWSAEEFSARLAWAEQFFEHWPQHVMASLQDRLPTS